MPATKAPSIMSTANDSGPKKAGKTLYVPKAAGKLDRPAKQQSPSARQANHAEHNEINKSGHIMKGKKC